MTKLKEAWTLVSLSLRLLKKNPFLFGYMLAAVLAVTALFSGASYPVVCNWRNNVTQSFEPYASIDFSQIKPSGQTGQEKLSAVHPHWKVVVLTALAVQLPGTFALLFFNVALLASVRRILNGQPVSFFGGLALAWEKRVSLIQWTLFTSTIGVAISLIQNKTDHWLVRKVIGAIGIAWNCVTFLVIPVIAVEGCNPVQALRRSADLFRRTWGQNFAATIGIEAVETLAWVVTGVIPGLVIVYLSFMTPNWKFSHWEISTGYFTTAGIILIPGSWVLIKMAGEITKMVFRMALYVFAAEGVIPEEYRDENCAWFVARET